MTNVEMQLVLMGRSTPKVYSLAMQLILFIFAFMAVVCVLLSGNRFHYMFLCTCVAVAST